MCDASKVFSSICFNYIKSTDTLHDQMEARSPDACLWCIARTDRTTLALPKVHPRNTASRGAFRKGWNAE